MSKRFRNRFSCIQPSSDPMAGHTTHLDHSRCNPSPMSSGNLRYSTDSHKSDLHWGCPDPPGRRTRVLGSYTCHRTHQIHRSFRRIAERTAWAPHWENWDQNIHAGQRQCRAEQRQQRPRHSNQATPSTGCDASRRRPDGEPICRSCDRPCVLYRYRNVTDAVGMLFDASIADRKGRFIEAENLGRVHRIPADKTDQRRLYNPQAARLARSA